MAKQLSRPKRFYAAIAQISESAGEIESLKEEYEEWRDGLPENLADSELGNRLDETIDAFDQFVEAASELESVDLPLGFGRD